jgi:hypothetical protein
LRVAAGSDEVAIWSFAALTLTLNVLVTRAGFGVEESLAVTVTVPLAAAVGVPLMDPVLGSRVNPVGSLPVVTAQVYGAAPPLADNEAR